MRTTPEVIAGNVQKYREKRGLSQSKLAIEARLQLGIIQRVESPGTNGHRISLRSIMRIAETLGVQVTTLTGRRWVGG